MQRSLVALTALALGLLGTARAAPPARGPVPSPVHAAKVTVLSTMLADDKGVGEWGFAAMVEVDGKRILYDTGARPRTVLDNARELHVELGDVEDVILSHFHDDHTGGLRELAARNPVIPSLTVRDAIWLPPIDATDRTAWSSPACSRWVHRGR